MMKKRIVSLGLAAMMTAGLFAGCGNSSESQGDSTASGSKSDDIEVGHNWKWNAG